MIPLTEAVPAAQSDDEWAQANFRGESPEAETTMRFGIHLFPNEREAVAFLLTEGFLLVGQGRKQHFRHPNRDADRWVQRADVQRTTKFEQSMVRVHVWRAFT